MRKPTLQSLAEELNVSRQTVSNAINTPHKVRPETLERVRAAIERAGYHPSAAARALRTRQSMTIALRLPSLSDGLNGQIMDDFLHALTTEAAARDYRVLLFTASDPHSELEQLRQLRATQSVDGCVLTDTHDQDPRPAQLTSAGTPFVAFGRPWRSRDVHPWVDVDGRAGTALAVAHLAAQGHDPIGFIGWPDVAGAGVDRRMGWVEATGYDEETQQRYSEATPDGLGQGATAMARLIERGVRSVVTASDSLAIGAAHELQRHGLAPAVVGFDDTPVARALGLSSMRQPVAEAARLLVDMLLGRIADPSAPPSTRLLAPELVVRGGDAYVIPTTAPTHTDVT